MTFAALVACGAPVGPERRSEAGPPSIEDLSREGDVDLVCPPVARAPSDDDRIAFVTDRHGGQNPEIYVMDADGSNQLRVTDEGLWSVHPAWSPDHDRIAFDGSGDIYVIDADGSNRTRLTSPEWDDWWVAWSPDGSRIAFTRDVTGWFEWDIYVTCPDGSSHVRLTNGTGGDRPTWSPDGSRIAFGGIKVVDSDGTDLVSLTPDLGSDQLPAWSPDGTKIAFTRSTREGEEVNFDVYVMNADGSNVVNLTSDPAHDEYPTWSPDGNQIAFSTNRDGNFEIYVMEADGSNLVNLTRNPAFDGHPAWWR